MELDLEAFEQMTPTAVDKFSDDQSFYSEPVDTPGVVPLRLKRETTRLFPVLEIIQRYLTRVQPTQAVSIETIITVIALYNATAPALRLTGNFILKTLTSKITISENDPAAQEVSKWISDKVMGKRITTDAYVVTGQNVRSEEDFHMNHGGRRHMLQDTETIRCMPPFGAGLFWVGFRPFLLSRTRASKQGPGWQQSTSSMDLTTLGWSLDPLMKFLATCHDYEVKNNKGKTIVHYYNEKANSWNYGTTGWSSVVKDTRKMDTVDLNDGLKAKIINDAENYYRPETQKQFADCGIPYRRGYLFHGPPGTGKTSFCAALAGHLNCELFVINLAARIGDSQLQNLFLSLPRKCVVVMEDIDSAGIGREQGPIEVLETGADDLANFQAYRKKVRGETKASLTLSGLLNAIDGSASAEGRLLILTSNHPDTLDPALVRPGRIDVKAYFGHVTPTVARAMFKRIIGRNVVAYTDKELQGYADAFSQYLPRNIFTPAEVQNFLQLLRGKPEKALESLNPWILKRQNELEKAQSTA